MSDSQFSLTGVLIVLWSMGKYAVWAKRSFGCITLSRHWKNNHRTTVLPVGRAPMTEAHCCCRRAIMHLYTDTIQVFTQRHICTDHTSDIYHLMGVPVLYFLSVQPFNTSVAQPIMMMSQTIIVCHDFNRSRILGY